MSAGRLLTLSQQRHGFLTQNERDWTVFSWQPPRPPRVTLCFEGIRFANRREFNRDSVNRCCASPLCFHSVCSGRTCGDLCASGSGWRSPKRCGGLCLKNTTRQSRDSGVCLIISLQTRLLIYTVPSTVILLSVCIPVCLYEVPTIRPFVDGSAQV